MRFFNIAFSMGLFFVCLGSLNAVSAQSLQENPFLNKNTEFRVNKANQSEYNPWTIHRKISAIGLAGSIAATFVGALAMDDETFATTVIPVVGPFISITRIENDENLFYQPGGKQLLTASGIVQSVFLIYFTASLIGESNYKGKHLSSIVSVAPAYTLKGFAISMNVQF